MKERRLHTVPALHCISSLHACTECEREEEDEGGGGDDGRACRDAEVVGGKEPDDARDEGGEDGDEVVLLDAARHVARGCPRQDEERIDDENADPLDADGDDDGEQGGKRRLDAHDGDAAAAGE